MELEKIPTEAESPFEGFYIVQGISYEDIGTPSRHFLEIVRKLTGIRNLNTFTIAEFTKQVQQHFADNPGE